MTRHVAYPASSDFDRLLRASGLKNITGDADALNALTESFGEYLQAAVDAWDKATNYLPFLAASTTDTENNVVSVTSARHYSPQGAEGHGRWESEWHEGGRVLELDGGLVGLTSVTTHGAWDDTGSYTGGQTRVVNRDFSLYPENALARRKPVTWLEFRTPVRGGFNSIEIQGVWGYCASAPTNWIGAADVGLPGQAFRAVLMGALLQAQPDIEALIGRGLLGWTEAGVSEKYRDKPLETTFGSAQELWDTEVEAFHLDKLGF